VKRIAAVVLAALAAAACSNPVGINRAPAYFDALRPVAVEVTGAIAETEQVFEGAYESDAMRATRLSDVRAGHTLAIAADRAERLEPGSVYQADHDRYLATIAEIREIYRSYDEAVARGDVGAAAAAATGMEVAAGLGFAGLSAEFCGRVTFDMRLCDRPTDPGAYQAVVYTAMLELAAGYLPLLRPAPAALDRDEAAVYLREIDAAAVERLDAVRARLAGADIPSGSEGDAETLLSMLDAAAALHDSSGDHADLPAIFCSAAATLTPTTADLTSVLFDDDDLGCST
jgi:hypothetical protein